MIRQLRQASSIRAQSLSLHEGDRVLRDIILRSAPGIPIIALHTNTPHKRFFRSLQIDREPHPIRKFSFHAYDLRLKRAIRRMEARKINESLARLRRWMEDTLFSRKNALFLHPKIRN
jgi:DNA-binding GntR family transcriptional regulator